MSDRPRFVPASTYRLQVHAGFTLEDARVIVPYLIYTNRAEKNS